ncbi:MAG: hypothetical protein H0U28_06090, partial [Nocardioidaceae bacterium]|nr:hypothetical protein [Nocardioidaceae bacterium]
MIRSLKTAAAVAAVPVLLFATAGVAVADNIQDTIEGTGALSLVAGSTTGGTAGVRVVGNNSDGATKDEGCNWDAGESPLVLDVVTPTGVTATPDPLSLTTCGNLGEVSVTFTASASAVSGTATVAIISTPAGGGGYTNQVSIPITISQPPNTKPSVSVSGVTDGAEYEIGSVPPALCDVTDAEDGDSQHAATLTGILSHGLGSQAATCDYTDAGELAADTQTATYTVVDTGDPTISHSLSGSGPNSNGWY